MLRRQNIRTHALKDNFHKYNFHVFWQPGHDINFTTHLNLCNFSTPWRKRALTSPSTPHPQTEAQCKCGQNSYPQLAHINKSFSAVERSSFSNFFFILTKEMWPRDIYWQFVFFLALPKLSMLWWQSEKAAWEKLGWGEGWYVAAVGYNRRALHSRLSEGVAEKI